MRAHFLQMVFISFSHECFKIYAIHSTMHSTAASVCMCVFVSDGTAESVFKVFFFHLIFLKPECAWCLWYFTKHSCIYSTFSVPDLFFAVAFSPIFLDHFCIIQKTRYKSKLIARWQVITYMQFQTNLSPVQLSVIWAATDSIRKAFNFHANHNHHK